MPSPHEIETKQFLTVLRGFDPEEVSAFLSEVADQVRALLLAIYAALPPGEAVDDPDLDALLHHGEAVSGEAARLAEAGRAARLDADAVRRLAEVEAQTLQAGATEQRIRAVREAGRLLQRARQEADEIVAEAERRRQETLRRMGSVDERLAQAEQELQRLRASLRAAGSATVDEAGQDVG